ncbi:ABC-2 type transport system ATP-binding protein [Clostridium tetanomorphum]|uniref:ABC transporter ATP-binding protein n=1 Tax=Clostridium tetanomorphum TaxID=1553 RepID=A0A923J067_CLOTT|nr:ABC transporter ATP-binding protein [Clostridium tetanomorphum]KAJ53889.1 ABC transporter ATP-binding protein [Clostridium tetanomorphum DSM 665]MBC2397404.1 ABC transporter ATP-binding protein [Clostridium tetanomorphum]MBP1862624.1 ABC-2 type transport system ATP-binding protein [Clostridium tetanomorphum]NRS85535.1 ABC-2 type transport system ATP-binding protein [Clostridium tetanomorphum]NRZ96454.1 ABC-2 type transport system ATP-binding protein [Clostridium tetanomorphum]
MLQINNVYKSLGDKQILKDVNLTVNKGSIFGLIGENGAGKTTLIKCILGVYKIDKGTIKILNEDVFENNTIKEKIGYVADENQFFLTFKISELIKLYSLTYCKFSMDRFKELNDIFNIPLNKIIKDLSKGMKMRVSLMLNLSIMPEILVLDEPTSGLDPIIKKKVINIILEDVAQRGTTVFISSHHLSDLERICDTVAFISSGKINYINNIDDMKSSIKKLQVVFKDTLPEDIQYWSEILTIESIGRVNYIITKKYSKELVTKLLNKGALFVDELNLSLEDIFIYSAEDGERHEKSLA